MKTIEIVFWCTLFIIFYTYVGYAILLYIMVKIKETFTTTTPKKLPEELPEITLLIAAYNEETVVNEKMENCLALNYPTDKLKICWVTDGSSDQTNTLLAEWPQANVIWEAPRKGKTAALNRSLPFVNTPLVIFTDANTILNTEAILEIVKRFTDPLVGCVAGEKRIRPTLKSSATAGEGAYWKYESALKMLDDRLYSTVGAAGELFAIRTPLFKPMPADTLLDDFILSLSIVAEGYKIAYCSQAYAMENTSANMHEEAKRKVRIAAGGLQAIWRLKRLLNIFRYGLFSFQYISHRVLRWSVTPILLFLLFPLNILLTAKNLPVIYCIILSLQILFYGTAALGYYFEKQEIKNKYLFIPYYFLFMNINVIRGFFYLQKNKGNAAWEKAKRA